MTILCKIILVTLPHDNDITMACDVSCKANIIILDFMMLLLIDFNALQDKHNKDIVTIVIVTTSGNVYSLSCQWQSKLVMLMARLVMLSCRRQFECHR
jgi:hypothetical protein